MTLIRTLNLEFDVVEIHYNELLKNKPYLVKVFSYNSTEPNELRLDEKELKNLYRTLKENKVL
jgi:hypothetical protein